jgi:hypothetical protein
MDAGGGITGLEFVPVHPNRTFHTMAPLLKSELHFLASLIVNAVYTVDGMELLCKQHLSLKKRLLHSLHTIQNNRVAIKQLENIGVDKKYIILVFRVLGKSTVGVSKEVFKNTPMAPLVRLADVDNPDWQPAPQSSPPPSPLPLPPGLAPAPVHPSFGLPRCMAADKSSASAGPAVFAHTNFLPRSFGRQVGRLPA